MRGPLAWLVCWLCVAGGALALLVVAVESIFAKFLNERNHALADRIDYRAAWVTSLAYALGMAVVFWIL